jgi:hypothetical protein
MIVPGHQPRFQAYGSTSRGRYGLSRDVNRECAFATPNLHDAYRYARSERPRHAAEDQSISSGDRRARTIA